MQPSILESSFSTALHNIAPDLNPIEQYRFAPPRRWRSDFAFPAEKILIEIEGVGGRSRHRTIQGYTADCKEYNAAALAGYAVLRYASPQITQDVVGCATEVACLVRSRQKNLKTSKIS